MMKRVFDIVFSTIGLILLSPLILIFICIIPLESKGSPFFTQRRVGRGNKDFRLIKFRSMTVGADAKGLLTVGERDNRVTGMGRFLRKYKLDEIPQLVNVWLGQMSIVGPRPEVRKYVALYTESQLEVLIVRPGLTDYASLEYIDENEILAGADDPESTYINQIMPHKLELARKYIRESSFRNDMLIILRTFYRLFR